MCLTDITQAVYDALLNDEALAQVTVLKAFPFAVTPTKLEKPVAAVAPAAFQGEAAALGEETLFGSFKVDVDGFLPFEDGSPATATLAKSIITAVLPLQPCAVAVSGVKIESGLFCYRITCTFTFSGAWEEGGNTHGNA